MNEVRAQPEGIGGVPQIKELQIVPNKVNTSGRKEMQNILQMKMVDESQFDLTNEEDRKYLASSFEKMGMVKIFSGKLLEECFESDTKLFLKSYLTHPEVYRSNQEFNTFLTSQKVMDLLVQVLFIEHEVETIHSKKRGDDIEQLKSLEEREYRRNDQSQNSPDAYGIAKRDERKYVQEREFVKKLILSDYDVKSYIINHPTAIIELQRCLTKQKIEMLKDYLQFVGDDYSQQALFLYPSLFLLLNEEEVTRYITEDTHTFLVSYSKPERREVYKKHKQFRKILNSKEVKETLEKTFEEYIVNKEQNTEAYKYLCTEEVLNDLAEHGIKTDFS